MVGHGFALADNANHLASADVDRMLEGSDL
jgi:hypothetical protein